MSIGTKIIAGVVGLEAGEAIADAVVDDDNILGHVAVGVLAAGVVGGLAEALLKETGTDSVIDDLLGIFD